MNIWKRVRALESRVNSQFFEREQHEHKFKELNRTYSKPSAEGKVTGMADELTVMYLTMGVTSIELRCECGMISEKLLVGDHTGKGIDG